MRAPAAVWRCEPDLEELAVVIRRYLHHTRPETTMKPTGMTPAEYAEALKAYNLGPDPDDPDAPLSPEEQALVDAQGDRIRRDEDE